MHTFAFDTETFLIQPGRIAPRMVCLQYAVDQGDPVLLHVEDPECSEVVEYALRSLYLVGHNVAYDMAVIAVQWPEYLPLIFEAYEADRVTCTHIRQKLIDIARGEIDGKKYGLGDVYRRATGIELDKTDPWRLKYGTLAYTEVSLWPDGARRYALLDAAATRDVYHAQDYPEMLRDQHRQARAAFWAHLASAHGVRTDPDAVARYYREVCASLARDKATCLAAGLCDWKGKRKTKVAAARMTEAMEALGEEVPRTETGRVSLTEDACLASADPLLEAYQRVTSASTIRSRVTRLYRGTRTPLQPRYDSLKKTGRMSTTQGDDPKPGPDGITRTPPQWGIQIQNIPRKGGMRECIIPRPGYLFAGCDYGGQELGTWAQVCLWSVGKSRLAEVLNAGEDPHTDMGSSIAGITYEQAKALTGDAKKAFKDGPRQSAKIADFGYPGGMGPATLARQARVIYRVMMSLPEAQRLKQIWLRNWPEAPEYFAWVNSLIRGDVATVKHFKSDRYRGNIPYTVTCNTFFQGLASDMTKDAGWRLARECYLADRKSPLFGSRTVWVTHDEFGVEVPDHPERAHLAATRLGDIMSEAAREWCPDVLIKAEPHLMRRWYKSAEPVYKEGMLVPWTTTK